MTSFACPVVFSNPAICAGIIYIKLEHLGLFPASKLAQASYYLLLPSIDFYWNLPPLILPVKMLVVHLLVSLGFPPPFLFPFSSLYNLSVCILYLFFPIMPLLWLNTSCLQILKTPLWLQLFMYNNFYHYISIHTNKLYMLLKIEDQCTPYF